MVLEREAVILVLYLPFQSAEHVVEILNLLPAHAAQVSEVAFAVLYYMQLLQTGTKNREFCIVMCVDTFVCSDVINLRCR